MKIAIATCDQRPEGTSDDSLLVKELKNRGHCVQNASWSDKDFDWSKTDLVLIRSTWDYYKKHEDFLSWCRIIQRKTRLFNPLQTVEWNFSKNYLSELSVSGAPVVPTLVSKEKSECLRKTEKLLKGGKVILKPAVSGASDLTFLISSKEQAATALDQILSRCEALIQPFIESIQTQGEISLIFIKGVKGLEFSHCALKKTKAGDFRVQEDFGGSVASYSPGTDLIELSMRVLSKIPVNALYARVDVVDYLTRPLIGEIELIEPELFFRLNENAPAKMARALENVSS